MDTRRQKWTTCIGCLILFLMSGQAVWGESYKIGMVRSPGRYSEAIRDGFVNFLQKSQLKDAVIKDTLGFETVEQAAKNVAIAKEYVNWKADLIVTIGSSTSHAIGQHFRGTAVPILFLGVTDPVAGGLVKAMGKPSGENITGVTFPIPLQKTMGILGKIFPAAKTYCFVYNSHLPPDMIYLKWIQQYAEKHGHPVIQFIDTTQDKGLAPKELTQADLFFGWYSVHLYRWAIKYPNVPFVGNTLEECRDGSVVSVYPKLPELGAQGGAMAVNILWDRVSPGKIPPEHPRDYGICFNLKQAKALKIKIPKGILELADEKVD
ncbi:MAG: hypothetical protein HQK60_06065 [Deltaproteobacteria bacterium]|nr:hypothetical protein [Deltaproteobacteria bacterium]